MTDFNRSATGVVDRWREAYMLTNKKPAPHSEVSKGRITIGGKPFTILEVANATAALCKAAGMPNDQPTGEELIAELWGDECRSNPDAGRLPGNAGKGCRAAYKSDYSAETTVEMLRAGETTQTIAEHFGISKLTLYSRMSQDGISVMEEKAKGPGADGRLEYSKEAAIELIHNGETVEDIRAKFRMGRLTLYKLLDQDGVDVKAEKAKAKATRLQRGAA